MPHVSTNVLKVGTGLQNSPGQFVDATPYHFSTLPQFDWEGTNEWAGQVDWWGRVDCLDFRAAVDGLASHRTVSNTQSYLQNGTGWI